MGIYHLGQSSSKSFVDSRPFPHGEILGSYSLTAISKINVTSSSIACRRRLSRPALIWSLSYPATWPFAFLRFLEWHSQIDIETNKVTGPLAALAKKTWGGIASAKEWNICAAESRRGRMAEWGEIPQRVGRRDIFSRVQQSVAKSERH